MRISDWRSDGGPSDLAGFEAGLQHQAAQTLGRHRFDITAEPVQKAAQVVRLRCQAAGKARPRSFSSDRAFELQIGAAGQQHRSLGYVDAAVLDRKSTRLNSSH